MDEKTDLVVHAHFDRPGVSRQTGGVRHLIVDFQAPPMPQDAETEHRPLNLALVIDASGSMNHPVSGGEERRGRTRGMQTCLEAAKEAACGVVDHLAPEDRLSVVSFSDDSEVHVSAQRMDTLGKQDAIEAISSIHTRGSTNLHDGWLKGAELVAQVMEQDKGYQNRVLILSDGMANQGIVKPDALGEIASGLQKRGITSSAVGIGVDYSTDQLEKMAEYGGGMLHHAQEVEEIVQVVMGELRSMETTFAENLELSCSLDAGGVRLDGRVLGLGWHRSGSRLVCPVGFLTWGSRRQVVVRFNVPQRISQDVLTVDLRVNGTVLDDELARPSWSQKATLQVVNGSAKDGLDVELGQVVANIWLSEMVRKAIAMNRDGDFEGTQAYLQEEMADFEAYCALLPDGAEFMDSIRKTQRSVQRPMRELARKEVGTALFKMARCMEDARPAMRSMSWKDHLVE